MVTEVAGLLAYIQGEKYRSDRVAMAYLIFAAVPIIGLLGILRSRQHLPDGENSIRHAFDRGSIMLARWALFGSLTILLVAYVGYVSGQLPGQYRPIVLQPEPAMPYQWKNTYKDLGIKAGDEGLLVPFLLKPPSESEPYPALVHIEAGLLGPAAEGWRIVEAMGERVDGGKLLSQPIPEPVDAGKPVDFVWRDLQVGVSYRVILKLHRSAKGVDRDTLLKKLTDEPKAVIAARTFYLP